MVATVDADDFEFLSQWKWSASASKQPWQSRANWYAWRFEELPRVKGKRRRRKIYMHRVVANTPADKVANHLNRNTLDNRKANLENCSHKENLEHACAIDRSDEW